MILQLKTLGYLKREFKSTEKNLKKPPPPKKIANVAGSG